MFHTCTANRSIGFPFSSIQLHSSWKVENWIFERKLHLSPTHTSFSPVQLHNACKESSACNEQRSQVGVWIIVLRTRLCLVGREFLHARHSICLYLLGTSRDHSFFHTFLSTSVWVPRTGFSSKSFRNLYPDLQLYLTISCEKPKQNIFCLASR